jgi:hypothetical protein
MKTLAAASVLMFGTAISGAAYAGCGSHEAKDDKATTAMETGTSTATTTDARS